MNADDIRKRIDERCSHFTFEYNGVNCGIDPIFNLEKGQRFEMWYGDNEHTAYTINEVMTEPLFGGECLSDISDLIDIIEF